MKRCAGIMLDEQEATPPNPRSPDLSMSPEHWGLLPGSTGMLTIPVLGPMTPIHSPSSEDEFEGPTSLSGAFSRARRTSTSSRRSSVSGRRASFTDENQASCRASIGGACKENRSSRRVSLAGICHDENRDSRRSSVGGIGKDYREGRRASLGGGCKDKENCGNGQQEAVPVAKRVKVQCNVRPALGEFSQFQGESASSSLASTPAKLPGNLSQQFPISPPKLASKLAPVDYNNLTSEELRDRLGVTGTEIASGWEREDLISVLQTLEEVIADMPALKVR